MGETIVREHCGQDQGDPAEPHRNAPASDDRLPPKDDPQQVEQANDGKDNRRYKKVAPAGHPLASFTPMVFSPGI
jgi:hypothetical protein